MSDTVTNYPVGEWMVNRDFYRYRGKHAILIECENIPKTPEHSVTKQYVVLSGCISCQLAKLRGLKAIRWLPLPD